MKNSRYDSRAKAIHGDRHTHKQPEVPAQEFWKTRVKSPEDVVTFYELYYPYYPKELVLSIADYYTKIIHGDAALPEYLNAKMQADKAVKWDFEEEIRQQKLEGEMNLTKQRLEKLLADEEESW